MTSTPQINMNFLFFILIWVLVTFIYHCYWTFQQYHPRAIFHIPPSYLARNEELSNDLTNRSRYPKYAKKSFLDLDSLHSPRTSSPRASRRRAVKMLLLNMMLGKWMKNRDVINNNLQTTLIGSVLPKSIWLPYKWNTMPSMSYTH